MSKLSNVWGSIASDDTNLAEIDGNKVFQYSEEPNGKIGNLKCMCAVNNDANVVQYYSVHVSSTRHSICLL